MNTDTTNREPLRLEYDPASDEYGKLVRKYNFVNKIVLTAKDMYERADEMEQMVNYHDLPYTG